MQLDLFAQQVSMEKLYARLRGTRTSVAPSGIVLVIIMSFRAELHHPLSLDSYRLLLGA